MDVAKLDRNVLYVAIVVHVCWKLLFLMFYLFSDVYIVSVYIWMLHIFYKYDGSVLSLCCVSFTMDFKFIPVVFACLSIVCFKCFVCV